MMVVSDPMRPVVSIVRRGMLEGRPDRNGGVIT